MVQSTAEEERTLRDTNTYRVLPEVTGFAEDAALIGPNRMFPPMVSRSRVDFDVSSK